MKHARKDYDRIQDPSGIIPDDEPVFLIRGQDVAGPDAVSAWADCAEACGADARIVERARRWANVMIQYQKSLPIEQQAKLPDMPAEA
jgi:hypothetical protein